MVTHARQSVIVQALPAVEGLRRLALHYQCGLRIGLSRTVYYWLGGHAAAWKSDNARVILRV